MQISISGRNQDVTSSMRDYAEKKCQKLERFDDRISKVDIMLKVEGNRHTVEIYASATAGTKIVAKETHEDMYAAVDLVIEKLEVQLKKNKEKLQTHKHTDKLEFTDSLPNAEPKEDTYDQIIDNTEF